MLPLLRTALAALLCVIAACAGMLPAAQRASAQDSSFGDARLYSDAQEYMLYLLNQARAQHGSPPLRMDHLAAEAALRHATEMLEEGYHSHWNRAGLKPTRRFNLLGGFHSVGENIYYCHAEPREYRSMIESAMSSLMDSEGHRRAILNPANTHVGMGFAQQRRDFFCVQEFTSQRGGNYSCKLYARVGDVVEFSGRYDPLAFDFLMICAAWEELPQKRDQVWLNKTSEYSEGDNYYCVYVTDRKLVFNELLTSYDMQLDTRTGWFRCNVALDNEGRAGMYYITLWLKDKRSDETIHAATASVEARK